MACNQGLSEIRDSPAALSLCSIAADITATARSRVTTATEKMTTPIEKTATAEKNVTTPTDNSHRQNQSKKPGTDLFNEVGSGRFFISGSL